MKLDFIRYVGREMNSSMVRKISSSEVKTMEVQRSLDVEVVHRMLSRLGINAMIPGNASVMVYSKLLDRPAINNMPEYLRGTEILRCLGIEGIDTVDLYQSLHEINDMDFSSMEEKLTSLFLHIEGDRSATDPVKFRQHEHGECGTLFPVPGYYQINFPAK